MPVLRAINLNIYPSLIKRGTKVVIIALKTIDIEQCRAVQEVIRCSSSFPAHAYAMT